MAARRTGAWNWWKSSTDTVLEKQIGIARKKMENITRDADNSLAQWHAGTYLLVAAVLVFEGVIPAMDQSGPTQTLGRIVAK